jgi:ATP-dependent helicase HrpB
LGALVLEEAIVKLNADQTLTGLCEAVQTHGLAVLDWSARAKLIQGRLAWLYANNPEEWADVSDKALLASFDGWLLPAIIGAKSIADIDVAQALLSRLDWAATQLLVAQAPERFETPAGTSHVIDYAPEQGPTVEVRVGELFGLTTHPMLAGGKVALVFQLLSPAQRPIAITSNLPAFWRGSWSDVRKDMKARYPRHVWPEDPSIAVATTKAKPRGT